MSLSDEANQSLLNSYNPADSRTWPYFPIVTPLKNGFGPASDAECDSITWEVWDRICETYGSFEYLYDAINEAMRLNAEWLNLVAGGMREG